MVQTYASGETILNMLCAPGRCLNRFDGFFVDKLSTIVDKNKKSLFCPCIQGQDGNQTSIYGPDLEGMETILKLQIQT
jgi:hypothetical protein